MITFTCLVIIIKVILRKEHFIIVLIFLASALILNAQSLRLDSYSTDEGLIQNTVFTIHQDSKGFIWLGTNAGVSKFDGRNFTSYGISDGLVASSVKCINEDDKGNIWIATSNGVSKLSNGQFTNYTSENGLPDNYIYSIAQANDGSIWFGTKDSGVAQLKNGRFYTYDKSDGFPENTVYTVVNDGNGNLWFGTAGEGIVKYDGNTFKRFNSSKGNAVNDTVRAIYPVDKNTIWAGGRKGISVIRNGEEVEHLRNSPKGDIRTIAQDNIGNFWIGVFGKGIFYYNGAKSINYKVENLNSTHTLSNMVDNRGDIWFGFLQEGFGRLPAEWFSIYNENFGLPNTKVFAINQSPGGSIYLGHYGDGVSIIKPDGQIETLDKSKGLVGNDVSSIFFDSENILWVSTSDGLSRVENGRIKNYTTADGLHNNLILDIAEDQKGNIWLAGEGGISKFNKRNNKITEIFGEEEGYGDCWYYSIHIDHLGDLWFGTEPYGIFHYNGNSFHHYDTSDGLSHNAVLDITQDRFNNYWFATDGGGVSRYDGENFTNFSKKDGLSGNNCYSIIENRGAIYVGTVSGLTKINYEPMEDGKEPEFKVYKKDDGLPSVEFNDGAIYKDRNGFLWMGTINGVIKVNPRLKPIPDPPPVYLKNVDITNFSDSNKVTKDGSLELEFDQNNLTFNFTAVTFANPGEVLYKFRLDGIEDEWYTTGEHRQSYRALPSGEYTFLVKAKVGDGIWGELASFSFYIHPPFYFSWWFITLMVMFFTSSVYGIYVWKTRQVKRRNIELANMVRERTKELEKEKNKSDDLLLNILPASLVDELKTNGSVKPREFKHVSILFTDFKGFTYTSSVLPAENLVKELNEIFLGFDEVIEKYGLEKLKTIGDSYMVAGGLPKETDNHSIKVVLTAMEMHTFISRRNETSAIKWDMRSGIHSGSVIAGVVGTKKFTYDIWGDTVNIASRMESSGEPNQINISAYTYMLIKDYFHCEYRGKVEAKGKGKIDMYFVTGIKEEKAEELEKFGAELEKTF